MTQGNERGRGGWQVTNVPITNFSLVARDVVLAARCRLRLPPWACA